MMPVSDLGGGGASRGQTRLSRGKNARGRAVPAKGKRDRIRSPTDKKKTMHDENWLFDQAPNVAAITSTHITKDACPVLLVTHYEDDHSWSFQSGLAVTMEESQLVGMGEIVRRDPTLVEIADLPPGWSAERDAIGGKWRRYKDEWEPEEE